MRYRVKLVSKGRYERYIENTLIAQFQQTWHKACESEVYQIKMESFKFRKIFFY